MHSPARFGSALLLIIGLLSPLAAQTGAPSSAPAPTPASPSASDAEGKLAIALRSYSLLDAEADRLRAANAQLTAEKSALQVKVAELQAAVPIAAQAAGLRDQLRQTQAQMAAYAEENLQLRNKLALGGVEAAHVNASAPAPAPVAVAAPAPEPSAPRTHVIVSGDTLVKISQAYYGTPNRWTEILAANHELRDEKSLVIGHSLIIP